MTDKGIILKNIKKIPIRIGDFSIEILYNEKHVGKSGYCYLRKRDIEEKIGVSVKNYKKWIQNYKDEYEKGKKVKNDDYYKTYYIKENDKAIEICTIEGFFNYLSDKGHRNNYPVYMLFQQLRVYSLYIEYVTNKNNFK